MTLKASKAEVRAGRILVRSSFTDLLVCRRLPGTWDSARKAWSFPATRAAAALLAKRLRRLQTTPEFDALLAPGSQPEGGANVAPPVAQVAPEAPPPVVVAEPEFVLPDGLRTRPWRHQLAALRFALERFAVGMHGLLLAMGMGTGKSLVALILIFWLRARRVVIFCPLRVVPVWVTQFERHVDAQIVVVALDEDAGSVAKKMELAAAKLKLAETLGVPFVAIINYDSGWREPFEPSITLSAYKRPARWSLLEIPKRAAAVV